MLITNREASVNAWAGVLFSIGNSMVSSAIWI
jgi:hypothetical protein